MKISTKKQLELLSKEHIKKKQEFESRSNHLKKTFLLKKSEWSDVGYGMIAQPNDPFKKFIDILNSDSELNRLSNEIQDTYIAGSLLIIKRITENDITIPGYDLVSFIKNPAENYLEIRTLIEGLSGYKHVHLIGEKIALEIPARKYLTKYPEHIKLVDYWVNNLKIFSNE